MPTADQRDSIVTIGNFDGVHLGHRAILDEVVAHAERESFKSVALTFEPHPITWFKKLPTPTFRLTSPQRKLTLLEAAGITHPNAITFDQALAALTPEAFVEQIVRDQLKAHAVYVGYDFNFGKGRSGSGEDLVRLCGLHHIEAHIHPPITHTGEPISSSRIRKALAEGELALANTLLGRPHDVEAEIVHGDARGRGLGFPTLNQLPDVGMMLKHGVYVTEVFTGGVRFPGITNVGVRPTFGEGKEANVETFVLDGLPLDASLYGEHARVTFLAFLREEMAFDGLDALKAQITADVRAAREHHGLER